MILMVFKLYVYKSRVSSTLNINTFPHQLVKVKNLEKDTAFSNKQKHDTSLKKWSIVAVMDIIKSCIKEHTTIYIGSVLPRSGHCSLTGN